MRDTKPKPFVFVLMPFHESFDDVYKLGIKPACEAAGAYCERVDEQIFQQSILEQVYNQITKADLIVSDMTGRNPNVFYETGYAHALGKKVVLLTQQSEDIPFDLQHYPHIIYGGKIVLLRDQLERQVSWYITQPDTSVFDPYTQVQFFVVGHRIRDGLEVAILQKKSILGFVRPGADYVRRLYLGIAVHNPSNRVIAEEYVWLSLILPSTAEASEMQTLRLPDGQLLVGQERVGRLYPQAWQFVRFSAQFPEGTLETDERIPCVLRVLAPTRTIDIPFYIRLDTRETTDSDAYYVYWQN